MVIFHSYVSLPEGTQIFNDIQISCPFGWWMLPQKNRSSMPSSSCALAQPGDRQHLMVEQRALRHDQQINAVLLPTKMETYTTNQNWELNQQTCG
jgi:hypothetical protein